MLWIPFDFSFDLYPSTEPVLPYRSTALPRPACPDMVPLSSRERVSRILAKLALSVLSSLP